MNLPIDHLIHLRIATRQRLPIRDAAILAEFAADPAPGGDCKTHVVDSNEINV